MTPESFAQTKLPNEVRTTSQPSSLPSLTKQQLSILIYVATFWQAHGTSPWISQIARAHRLDGSTTAREVRRLKAMRLLLPQGIRVAPAGFAQNRE